MTKNRGCILNFSYTSSLIDIINTVLSGNSLHFLQLLVYFLESLTLYTSAPFFQMAGGFASCKPGKKNNTSDPCLSKIQTARASQSIFTVSLASYNRNEA